MKIRLLLFTMLMLSFTGVATAQSATLRSIGDGNDALASLHDCEALGNLHGQELFASTYNCGEVSGYIDALALVLEISPVTPIAPKQVYDVVEQYLTAHPESREKQAVLLMTDALIKAWPKATARK